MKLTIGERSGRHAWLCALALSAACARPSWHLQSPSTAVTVQQEALFPETIAYDPGRGTFLVGSLRDGDIYEIDGQGRATPRVADVRLCSVLGIAVDSARGRLWAVSGDLGASVRPSAAGPKNFAAVGVYDLASGKSLHYVDLSSLVPGPHLLNGIALDGEGNAYVSDSFAATIYKVASDGSASVFVHGPEFAGEGISLNGVVVHPDGYLLVIKKSDGALFKIPLAEPARFVRVAGVSGLVGGDGLTLLTPKQLVVIANKTPAQATNAAIALASDDGWSSARSAGLIPLGDVYPTTSVVRDDTLYVVHSKLNELIQAPPEAKSELRMQAKIAPIAVRVR